MRIIIIGAGLLGVSTAYYLNRQGCAVTVLDRKEGAGMDTSYANGGMITPSQADPWNAPGIVGKILRIAGTETSPLRVKFLSLFSSLQWGRLFFANANVKGSISITTAKPSSPTTSRATATPNPEPSPISRNLWS